MGLDITAYRGLTKVENPELDSDGYPVAADHWKCRNTGHTEQDFPGRSEGLESNAIYQFAESFAFRAGSYGGYNEWRNWLARLSGYASAEDCWSNKQAGPFWELINFSDCEGTIGWIVSAKLAKDFGEFKEKASSFEKTGGYYFDRYCCWEKAFNMAAENGAVDFH